MAVISAQSFHLASFPSVCTMLLHHISLSVIVSESHRVHPEHRPSMTVTASSAWAACVVTGCALTMEQIRLTRLHMAFSDLLK